MRHRTICNNAWFSRSFEVRTKHWLDAGDSEKLNRAGVPGIRRSIRNILSRDLSIHDTAANRPLAKLGTRKRQQLTEKGQQAFANDGEHE
jgi:hypothetical protein